MRIRTKISVLSSLLVVSLAVGIASAVFMAERRNLVNNLAEEQKHQTQNLAAVCQQALATSDMLFIINYLKVLKSTPGVRWAYFVDDAGKILVHTDERFIYQPLSAWSHAAKGEEALERKEPVTQKGQRMGQASIGYSRDHMDRVIQEAVGRTLHGIAIVTLAGILLGLLGAWALAAYMARPIAKLAAGAQRIGRGDLDVVVSVQSADELGELTSQFNHMARKLKELDELKDEFISMVSHDLRSPLASIKMYLDYLLSGVRGAINPEQREMLQTCVESSSALGIFIDNLLDTAKIKAGKMEYHMLPFKLTEAIAPLLRLMQLGLQHKSIALEVPDTAYCPLVLGDRQRIEQVFANLLFNALKYTPAQGRIRLGWQADARGETTRVTVANTGRGIAPEDLPFLFSRFHQADVQKQKELRIKGTGLGLALVKQTIEAHHGEIWVESEPGKLTAFHFTLPLAAQPSPKGDTRHEAKSPRR